MRIFKNAGELLLAINTPKKDGGLANPSKLTLRRGAWVSGTKTYVVRDILKDKFGFEDVVVKKTSEGGFNDSLPQNLPFTMSQVNGKFWGATGTWYGQNIYQWEVVEATRSGGFVYESDPLFIGSKKEAENFIQER